jgi:glucose/arabinose dehydrogenase
MIALLPVALVLTLSLAACMPVGSQQRPRAAATSAAQKATTPAPAAPAGTAVATAPQAAPMAPMAPAPDAIPAGGMPTGGNQQALREADPPFVATERGRFTEPWAMAFLPDGRLLVTEKGGALRLFDPSSGQSGTILGTPQVAYGGQGGMGDVALHPGFASNRWVYLSYAEAGANSTYGAVVARGRLTLSAGSNGGSLSEWQVVWRQSPKVTGQGHYSHRIAFDAGGRLWITSGDRQKATPAQDMGQNLGKVLRLNDDGSVPADNPFAAQGGVAAQVWTLGHRNPLGIAFDGAGRVWTHEMGPAGGDELNLIERGSNYGWPIVSNGDNYDGSVIPDHPTRPEFNAPEAWWTPVIAPAGFVIYSGDLFPSFRGQGFIGGLASNALIRIRFEGANGAEYRRYPMGARIREVEQGPDGALWVLEDGGNARLLRLTPR